MSKQRSRAWNRALSRKNAQCKELACLVVMMRAWGNRVISLGLVQPVKHCKALYVAAVDSDIWLCMLYLGHFTPLPLFSIPLCDQAEGLAPSLLEKMGYFLASFQQTRYLAESNSWRTSSLSCHPNIFDFRWIFNRKSD